MNITVTSPRDRADREKLYRFLYGIWIRECGRELSGTDHDGEQIRDDLDDWADHFMALDGDGNIAGCVRANVLSKGSPAEPLSRHMGFPVLTDLFGPDNVAFISHLAISPALRGGTVISLVLGDLFRFLFETRVQVASCYCQLNLVGLYHRIGMRPYLPNFSLDGNMRVPLVGCINDRDHLEQAGSPLHFLLPPDRNDHGRAARLLRGEFPGFDTPKLTRMSARSLWAQLAHAAPADEVRPVSKLFQGLPRENLDTLLKRLPRLHLKQNEPVQVDKAQEAAMGILISGSLGAGIGDPSDPHLIYVIRPGEPFGELSTLTRIRSVTVLKALENSDIILLPENLFDRLGKKDPPLTILLYKNLLTILARRMAALTTALNTGTNVREKAATRVRRPALHAADAVRSATRRTESYHFTSLTDQDGELSRLIRQAQIAQTIEIKALKGIGLRNGDQVLDLGSGPGITSIMLARHFPDSRIIGVEPESQLRTRAEALAREQNLDRCVFMKGAAQDVPLSDNSVDFSYARLLFQHIPDPVTCLAEMKRVTRSGGIACVLDVDDGTIFIHPSSSEWESVEKRVARAQARYGGDRHVGRKLLGYMLETGFSEVRVDIVPVSTQMLGPDTFFDIVFGFKQQHLQRTDDWDEETARIFSRIRDRLKQPGAFASENMFVAHAAVP